MDPNIENRNVTIKALSNARELICDLLNPEMFISAPNGTLRYWRGLAALCEISPTFEASLVADGNPTNKVLNLWYKQDPKHSTIQKLLSFLEEMDRFDVISDICQLIDEDIQLYKTHLGTNGNILPLEFFSPPEVSEQYDAFLLYDQDDIDFAVQVFETMETKYQMRFCVKDRDLIGGRLEMDQIITSITEKCHRLVVILSDSFFKSSANDYFLKFAQAYGLDSQKKIIPCVYKKLETFPTHVKYLFILDYRKNEIFNFWIRLRDSILADPTTMNKVNRSKSDNGEELSYALQENNDQDRLKPVQPKVKFSCSVGDLNNLDSLSEPSLISSTSADDLGPYTNVTKKEKKSNWFKKFKSFTKRDKPSDCIKQEREKRKGFRKHLKAAAAVAN